MAKSKQNLEHLLKLIDSAESDLRSAQKLLAEYLGSASEETSAVDPYAKAAEVGSIDVEDDSKVIEGVFDGLNMVGPDGKLYSVPANYASKSKLVEGDTLKLTIQPDGEFIYKQIGPIERERLVGILERKEDTGEFYVLANGIEYRVLLASVTYFKGKAGDEAVILVPKGGKSKWSALENIIRAGGEESEKARPARVAATKDDLDEL